MGFKIGFTYDLRSDHPEDEAGLADDIFAEFDYEETIDAIADAIASGGHEVVRIGHARNLLRRIQKLDVDIVFNICEGVGSRNRESEVPVLLDLFSVPYVGSDGLTQALTLDKAMAKKLFMAEGVPTPKFFIAGKESRLSGRTLNWPVIVKPQHEGTSKGIYDDSIVTNNRALKQRIARIVDDYGQNALVEEFIPGREFTVLLIGNEDPVAFPPVQIQILGKLELGNLIYTSERVGNTEVQYVCPAKITTRLSRRLCAMAVAAYRAINCQDFGRVDFRVDDRNRLFVLEVNPLPSLAEEDVFPLVAKSVGLSYNELILKILNAAFARYGLEEGRIQMESMRQRVLASVGS